MEPDPAIQSLLLDAAEQVHGGPGIFHQPRQFPGAEAVDLPLERRGAPVLPLGAAVPPAPPALLARRPGPRPPPLVPDPPRGRAVSRVLAHARAVRLERSPTDQPTVPRPEGPREGRARPEACVTRLDRLDESARAAPPSARLQRAPVHAPAAHRARLGSAPPAADPWADTEYGGKTAKTTKRAPLGLARAKGPTSGPSRSTTSALWSLPRRAALAAVHSTGTSPRTSTWSIRRSLRATQPAQGLHVRPGRRPIRRAASAAASSNRARRRP